MEQQKEQNFFQNSLNEEEPPHPKTLTHIHLRSNNQKKQKQMSKNQLRNNHIQVKTAREPFRLKQQQSFKRDIYTTRNSRVIIVNPPSNNNSPKANEDQLFVPQRVKKNQQNKFFSQKISFKQKSTSFHASSNLKQSNPSIKLHKNDQNKSYSSKDNKLNPLQIQQNRATIHHIAHLRKYQNTQKSRQAQLNNRLRFLTVQKQRDDKRLEFARRKYEKVVAVRSQFINEKQSIQKRKVVNYLEEMNQKLKKIEKIKQQQKQKQLSVSRLSQTKSHQASRLRTEEKEIINKLRVNEISEIQKKKQFVKASLLRSQKVHQKIIQVNKSRIETIRTLQNRQIAKSYLNVSQRQKINLKLYEKLQKQIVLINENKQRSTNQIKKYEQFLGLNKKRANQNIQMFKNRNEHQNSTDSKIRKIDKKPTRTGFSGISTSGSKSFYVTNY